MYLIFDTETTGFPKKDYKDPINARVTQLAWALYNSEGKLLESFQSYIYPDGWEIPSVEMYLRDGKTQEVAEERAKFFVDNGHTTERNIKFGIPMEKVLPQFIEAIENCEYIIAHNMNFDHLMMAIEFYRFEVKAKNIPVKVCTMQSTTDLLRIKTNRGHKWPTLMELYQFLFKKPFEGAHDANADVIACADCFFELKKRKLVNLTKPENVEK